MSLNGMRILLVEDEALVAMSVEDMLADLGCEVAASASTIDEAFDKAQAGGFECALLDVSLGGKAVFPVAEMLSERGIPLAFASGYGRAALPEAFQNYPIVSKPFQLEDLAAALSTAMANK
ncbi:response regulator [Pseudaminobacter sp. NGMCC 1.201702]|uniref:response regulator n=1 Tax=Pseudaminobacter sp. NGMCC 1.201702 TaxID=3391825 RepID=UPI0039EEB653